MFKKKFVLIKSFGRTEFWSKKWFNNAKAPKNWVQNIWSKLGHYQLRYCQYGKSCLDKCPCDISHLLEKVSGTGQMSPSHLKSVHNGPRYLHLKFGQNPVSNSWDMMLRRFRWRWRWWRRFDHDYIANSAQLDWDLAELCKNINIC